MRFDGLVLNEQRHLKWRALDPLEHLLMILCGVCITGFSVIVLGSIFSMRAPSGWGVAAATRRNDHLYLAVLAESMTGNRRLFFELFNRAVVLCVAFCMIYFGFLNFLDGFKSLRMPSMTPIATLYIAIPICGALVALFTVEQMVNGWLHGFPDRKGAPHHESAGSEVL